MAQDMCMNITWSVKSAIMEGFWETGQFWGLIGRMKGKEIVADQTITISVFVSLPASVHVCEHTFFAQGLFTLGIGLFSIITYKDNWRYSEMSQFISYLLALLST